MARQRVRSRFSQAGDPRQSGPCGRTRVWERLPRRSRLSVQAAIGLDVNSVEYLLAEAGTAQTRRVAVTRLASGPRPRTSRQPGLLPDAHRRGTRIMNRPAPINSI